MQIHGIRMSIRLLDDYNKAKYFKGFERQIEMGKSLVSDSPYAAYLYADRVNDTVLKGIANDHLTGRPSVETLYFAKDFGFPGLYREVCARVVEEFDSDIVC